jgi:DNA-binding GntR family transcriptional regulator
VSDAALAGGLGVEFGRLGGLQYNISYMILGCITVRAIKSFRSKNELVYQALRTAIIQGELPPRRRLVIDELAAELGVSQIPVREALRQLEADGFVTIEPYVGATVTPIEAANISEIFGLLEGMEIVSGRAACARLTAQDLQALEGILHRLDDLADSPDDWSQMNVNFHRFICESAGTLLVKMLMDKTLDHWDRLRTYYLKDVFAGRIAAAQADHWRMFEAIRDGDADRLEMVVREHNRAALAAYTRYLQG